MTNRIDFLKMRTLDSVISRGDMKRDLLVYTLEDNEWYNKLLVNTISDLPGFKCVGFEKTEDFCLQFKKQTPDIVTLDFYLDDSNALDVLDFIQKQTSETEVIVISEQTSVENAIKIFKKGVFDYLIKGADVRERLISALQKIAQKNDLISEVKFLRKQVDSFHQVNNLIIGESDAIKKVFARIEKASKVDLTVSIFGETGTGKELVAQSIHKLSNRKNEKFVAVNVAAIPKDLVESELFGHEKGAFTGAVSRRIGKFEEANNGTLFLDEIGELDINIQAKLLRVIQENEFSRLGSNEVVKTNCRIIIATHKNLATEVREGRFREDLYFRLLGIPIELPPLRDRGNDVVLLAEYYSKKFAEKNNLPYKPLSKQAIKKLLAHQWPGNVRELKSVIELSNVFANGSQIEAEDIDIQQQDLIPQIVGENKTLKDYTEQIIKIYLNNNNQDVLKTAKQLDISHSTIYRMLKRD